MAGVFFILATFFSLTWLAMSGTLYNLGVPVFIVCLSMLPLPVVLIAWYASIQDWRKWTV